MVCAKTLWALGLGFSLAGCGKKSDAVKPDPMPPSSASSASSTKTAEIGSLVSPTGPNVCRNGVFGPVANPLPAGTAAPVPAGSASVAAVGAASAAVKGAPTRALIESGNYGAIGALSSVFGSTDGSAGGVFEGFATSSNEALAASTSQAICKTYDTWKECFKPLYALDRKPKGLVGVDLAIETSGKVTSASLVPRSVLAEKDEAAVCLVTAFRNVGFAPGSAHTARYTINFDLDRNEEGNTPVAFDKTAAKTTLVEGTVDLKGRLPVEVVKRIVRVNFPRFRACYEHGLAKDPALKGNISVQFVIDTTGAVESAVAAGSITNKDVTNCVVGIYRTLSFPEPESGKVTVTFPIELSMAVPK